MKLAESRIRELGAEAAVNYRSRSMSSWEASINGKVGKKVGGMLDATFAIINVGTSSFRHESLKGGSDRQTYDTYVLYVFVLYCYVFMYEMYVIKFPTSHKTKVATQPPLSGFQVDTLAKSSIQLYFQLFHLFSNFA